MRAALDGNFIAALLTILGYSVNDTVVIYDRIRENRKLLGKKVSFGELVNQSLNQSLKRTLRRGSCGTAGRQSRRNDPVTEDTL